MASLEYGNGIPITRAFDRDDRLTAQTASIVQDLGFHFDPNGNITGITDTLDPTRHQAFGYDALDRLVEARGRYGDLRYTYDAVGNRLNQIREAEATALLAEATEAREEAADLRTAADTFTAQAQAAEALAAEYRALAESPPSAQIATHYLYDPEGRLLGEYDAAGQVEREYVYLDGLPLAQITGTAIAYIHTDHLGTPESLTDQAQAIVWQAHHDPFGKTTVTTRAVEHNLRFPGQYFDAETGLHYNYFRDYDPGIGRYIQSDPIGLANAKGVRALYGIFLTVLFGLPRRAWPRLRPTIASTCSLKRSLPKGAPVRRASRICIA
ncbi:MAG: RHS repeat domain-containing protein [Gammaproteobacteria bacterium]